jgi:hypothetical protein
VMASKPVAQTMLSNRPPRRSGPGRLDERGPAAGSRCSHPAHGANSASIVLCSKAAAGSFSGPISEAGRGDGILSTRTRRLARWRRSRRVLAELDAQRRRETRRYPQAAHAFEAFGDVSAKRRLVPRSRQDDLADQPGVTQGDRKSLADDRIVVARGIADQDDARCRRILDQ